MGIRGSDDTRACQLERMISISISVQSCTFLSVNSVTLLLYVPRGASLTIPENSVSHKLLVVDDDDAGRDMMMTTLARKGLQWSLPPT
jgi:hypothetical protein